MNQAKVLLFLILFSTASTTFSQGGTSITRVPKNYNTFQLGIIGAVDLCYRSLENKQRETSVANQIDIKNSGETFKFGYHAGLTLGINVSNNFGMEIGVIYANRGYETKLTDYIYVQPEPTMPTQGRSIYNYNFIDVPIRANFFAGKGKLKFYGSVGIITNVLVGQNETFVKKYADGRKEYDVFETNNTFEQVTFSGSVAAGIDYYFNKHVSLRLAPCFNHNLGRFSNTPLSVYLWNAGFSATIFYGWY